MLVALPPRESIPLPSPPRVRVERLPNGLRLAVAARPAAQVVLRLAWPWGSAADPPTAYGAAHLLIRMLGEGTASYPDEAFLAAVDDAGLAWHPRVAHEAAWIDVVALPETWSIALDLLAEAVRRPTFPMEALDRLRSETLEELRARADDPAHVADDRLAELAFGAHPYGRLPQGRPDHLERIDRGVLQRMHARYVRPGGAVLVVAGEVDRGEVEAVVRRLFRTWIGSTPQPTPPPLPRVPVAAGTHHVLPWPDATQAEIRLLRFGWAYGRPGWAAALVANHILGGNTITGRLGARLREELGWTYGVRSWLQSWRVGGVWAVEAAIEGGHGRDAVRESLEQARRLAAEGPRGEELDAAREAVTVGLLRGFETPAQLVSRWTIPLLYGLPDDWWRRVVRRIRRVDAASVRRAVAAWRPERVVCVQVGE